MREIQLSDETYNLLLRRARSFEDNAETVILRLLDEVEETRTARPEDGHAERAPAGSLLPEGEYWLPILKLLEESGGEAPAGDVIEILEEELHNRFTDLDFERLNTGEVRWKNRARFARLRMCERGLLSDEKRGIWIITEAGRRFLQERPGQ